MLAKDLISDIVPALHTSDTGQKALNWMDVFRVSHLPIINDKEFLGLISDTDIYDMNMADEPIGNHKLSLFSPFIYMDQHIYEVIEIVARLKLTVVPVLDRQKNYLGMITNHDLVQYFAGLTAVKNPGAILVLELHQNDYFLSQIAQIVESNDAKILSLYIQPHDDSTKMEVILKVNRTDVTSIISTFERYDYNVKASYMNNREMESFYASRYDEFMMYLSI
ncbi:MAG TPA: CBS domain-containing protein [Bacteroidetes bacterium]|nr:CBS domain-containing protein [Bacteroidota bacterium]